MKRIVVILLIILLTSSYSFPQSSTETKTWPHFRGHNSSGLADENAKPPVQFGPSQNLLWKVALPVGHSSPCIWGNNIFLTGFEEEKKELSVFCINRSNGKIKWSRIVATEKIERVNSLSSPATATPATDGERVYVYFGVFWINML